MSIIQALYLFLVSVGILITYLLLVFGATEVLIKFNSVPYWAWKKAWSREIDPLIILFPVTGVMMILLAIVILAKEAVKFLVRRRIGFESMAV